MHNRTITFTKSIEDKKHYEEWVLTEDKRHGMSGYRCCRYLSNNENFETTIWDERYMFFLSLDSAYLAFINDDLKSGREAF